MIDEYIQDIAFRYRVYSKLVSKSIITLSQNTGFEKFESIILNENILEIADRKKDIDKNQFRKISLQKLQRLNPGKIFHIQIGFRKRIADWSSQLSKLIDRRISHVEYLDTINNILPTRMVVSELTPDLSSALDKTITLYSGYKNTKTQVDWEIFYLSALNLFMKATNGIYSLKDNMLDFYEFTAIYPVGTLNEFVKIGGQQIPLYPFPGKRSLRIHQRTKIADHIPDVSCYSYLPWIPYMHVGTTLHNSFHSLWFSINPKINSFIPIKWKNNSAGSRTGEPYTHLWLLSRGPMSHGCTHVNAGHISELRQILPSAEKTLLNVETYRNKSNHFDVFDIDGNGKAEVIGVKYFYAYSLKNKKPFKLRAGTDRISFYKWLYKNGFHINEGKIFFDRATTTKFIGRTAKKGKTYTNIKLYEADNSVETIQFYHIKNIAFARELRRVSSTYNLDKKILELE
jgi:hypothetical protein